MKKGISGLDKVLANLNKAINGISINGQAGLIEAGALVRREGQKQTPVDTANLVNSWYGPTIFRHPDGVVAELGLTASYAPFVHEMTGANFTVPRPSAQSKARKKGAKSTAKAKFLEDPLKENEKRILAIIARKTKLD